MISVCITCRYDQEETNATIRSIRETAGDLPEVVVLDDGSDQPLLLDDKNVVFRTVHGRAGVGPARHIAATMASRKHLLIIDAHMRFEPGWYERALERLESSDDTLWGCTCVHLNAENMQMKPESKTYNGATLNFFGPNKNKPHLMQFIEPVWIPKERHPANNDVIPCVLGAAYFMPRSLFFKIGGMRMLRHWGSSEPYLSLKVWLAGGECRQMTDVRIGHQFRTATTYTYKIAATLYNKLMIAATLFPEDATAFMVAKMRQHALPAQDFKIAMDLFRNDQSNIEIERVFAERVFTRSLEEYLERFGMPRFWT